MVILERVDFILISQWFILEFFACFHIALRVTFQHRDGVESGK